MSTIKMLKFFPNTEGKHEGDVFELADPSQLLQDGFVELYTEPEEQVKVIEPFAGVKIEPKKKFFKKGGKK